MVGMGSLIPSYIEKVDPELSIDFKVATIKQNEKCSRVLS